MVQLGLIRRQGQVEGAGSEADWQSGTGEQDEAREGVEGS